jgi:hypothetical protein
MADVASKQQTTALFLSTIVTRTRRHTEPTKKNWQTWWETRAVPENIQFSFTCSFFTQFNLECMGPFTVSTSVHYWPLISASWSSLRSSNLLKIQSNIIPWTFTRPSNSSPVCVSTLPYQYHIVISLTTVRFSTGEVGPTKVFWLSRGKDPFQWLSKIS